MAKSSEKLEYLNKNHSLEDGLTLWYPPPRLLPFEFPPEMTHTSHHIARPTSGNHHKLCCYVYIYMIFMLNVPSWCEKGAGVGLSLKCASLKIKPFHRFLFGAFFFSPLTDCRCESFASFYLQKKFSEKQIPHRSQFSGINEYNQRGFSLRHRNMNRNKINCRSVYRIFIRSKNVPGAGWDVASWLELVMWKQSFYVWKWRLRQWDGTKELKTY